MSKEKKEVAYIYVEAANGMEVRIPADKYPQWKAEQDRIRAGGKPNVDPQMRQQLRDLILGKK